MLRHSLLRIPWTSSSSTRASIVTDPVATARNYEKAIAAGGACIVSMYDAPTTGRVWRALDRYREPRDAAKILHAKGSWEVRLYGM